MRLGKLKKRWLIYRPPGMKGLKGVASINLLSTIFLSQNLDEIDTKVKLNLYTYKSYILFVHDTIMIPLGT